jgi:hypothetical protein
MRFSSPLKRIVYSLYTVCFKVKETLYFSSQNGGGFCLILRINSEDVRIEVFTAVTMKNIFWDVALCTSCVNRRRRYVPPKRRLTED